VPPDLRNAVGEASGVGKEGAPWLPRSREECQDVHHTRPPPRGEGERKKI